VDIPLEAVRSAAEALRPYWNRSHLLPSSSLSAASGRSISLKLESLLPTGSFKVRGALWALLANARRRPIREVTTASTGNHGAAVAYAAKLLEIPATIFLPSNPNPVKRSRIAAQGAAIVEVDEPDLAAARAAALQRSGEGVYYLDDATDEDLPAGPGTMALEILEQSDSVDELIVPIGDTALIRGVAAAAKQLRPGLRIVGVQAEGAPAYTLSWRSGRAISTERCATIADGLATRVTESRNVSAIRELVDDIVLVSDREMVFAMGHLALEDHVVAEPAGAAATAALLFRSCARGAHAVALVTGGNVTTEILTDAIRLHGSTRGANERDAV